MEDLRHQVTQTALHWCIEIESFESFVYRLHQIGFHLNKLSRHFLWAVGLKEQFTQKHMFSHYLLIPMPIKIQVDIFICYQKACVTSHLAVQMCANIFR